MRLLVFVIVLLLGLPVFAWNEPDAFRGVPWGASEQALKEKLNARSCNPTKSRTLGDRVCFDRFTIGSVQVTGGFWFRSDKFVGAVVQFDSKEFSRMEDIFTERYGPPTGSKDEVIQNRMGARFVNRVDEWVGENIYISLSRYGNKITQGRAFVWTKKEWEVWAKEREEEQKKGAEDL